METQELIGVLGRLDGMVLVLSVALLFVIAYFSGRRERDTQDFFLGGRRVPALIACLSFVATEVSAISIMDVPARGFSENWYYLQFFVGSALARVLVASIFIPAFYQYNCTTIYEFLRHRFGPQTQYTGSIFFFITRTLASGVRLYAACLGVSIILGWGNTDRGLLQALVLFTLVGIVFIAFGGIKAVVWTGAYAATVFYATGLIVIVYLLGQLSGGWFDAWQVAQDAGRLAVFNFSPSLADPKTFWAGSLNAFFIGLCVFGTDQELMQRLLTVKTRQSSQRALLATILAALPITLIYLALGTLLFVFYRQHPGLEAPSAAKEVLPHFVIHSLPAGLKGLVLSTIILASIDSPLSSLSSSFVTDIYRPLINRGASERHYLWISRIGVVGFGLILAAVAFSCRSVESILWFAFQIISVTGGSTLGVFLLGVLTRRRSNWGNVVAMIASAGFMLVLLYLIETQRLNLGWSWLIVLGTISTFSLSYVLGRWIDRTAVPRERAGLEPPPPVAPAAATDLPATWTAGPDRGGPPKRRQNR